MAQQAKGEMLSYRRLGNLDDMVLLVYHDAAWTNAESQEKGWW